MHTAPQPVAPLVADYAEELAYLGWVMASTRLSHEAAEAKAAETGKPVSASFLRIGYQATVKRMRIKQQLAKTAHGEIGAAKAALEMRETQPEYSTPKATLENMSELELEQQLQAAEAMRQAILAQIAALNLAANEKSEEPAAPDETEPTESTEDAENAEDAEILRQLYADVHPSQQNAYLGYGANGQMRVFPRLSTLITPDNPQPRPPIEEMRPYLYTLTPANLTQSEADENVNFLLGILGYPEQERLAG